MKKISYNPFEQILKGLLIVSWLIGFIFFFSAKLLLANDGSIQMVFSSGRAVIIDDKYDIARKRALEDALYLASIQGGAKVDGFSSIDSKTHLKENLVVRPTSEIIDFKIIDEQIDDTHITIKIQAALLHNKSNISCSNDRISNISFLQPHFVISSKAPAWTQKLPYFISSILFSNLNTFNELNILDKTKFFINPKNLKSISSKLNYENLTEESLIIKNGEYSVIPFISISSGRSRLHRFSRELIFNITMSLYAGPEYRPVDSFKYNFSLNLGNETGYSKIDSFYNITEDKIMEYLNLSLSKFHFRILDEIKCQPLETKAIYSNQQLIANLGTNQGLRKGKIGLISQSNPDNSMNDWSVVSVLSSEPDYSILETLNPNTNLTNLNGKIIRFLE